MQNTFLRLSLSLLALCAVAACSDGGTDLQPTYEELDPRWDAMYDRVSNLDPTPVMPATGTAVYDGYLSMRAGLSNQMLGEITMNANFQNNTIDGIAKNFADVQGGLYDGEIGLHGTITGNEFSGELGGTLIAPTDEVLTVTGEFDGDFVGENHDAIGADVDLEIQSPGAPAITYDGIFVAER